MGLGYVVPNSVIRIYKHVPLDPTYDHTIYWQGTAQTAPQHQQAYFGNQSYTVGSNTVSPANLMFTLQAQSYQRAGRGKLRIEIPADRLYDCNYLAFQNTRIHVVNNQNVTYNKWFYCFLTSVDYINENVSEITYEIDVMQTFYFDYTLLQTLVEREHSLSDTVGENLVPEDLETGEYISSNLRNSLNSLITNTGKLSQYCVIVASTFDTNMDDAVGGLYYGLYSGIKYNVFDTTEANWVNDLNSFIETIALNPGAIDNVVSIYYVPKIFTTGQMGFPVEESIYIKKPSVPIGTLSPAYVPNIDGYVPKNKKLFTYPYSFMYVTNLQGNSAIYPFEYFGSSPTDLCGFTLTGDVTPNPTALLIPLNYKGVTINDDEQLSLTGWPQVPYNIDSYKAWLAQNYPLTGLVDVSVTKNPASKDALAVAGLATIAAGAVAIGTGGMAPLVAGVGLALKAGKLLMEGMKHQAMPPQAHGTPSSVVRTALGQNDFYFFHKHIRAEMAEIIDNYFNMFGYATHKVKVPNRNARNHWTYTKTVGCKINGAMPAEAEKIVCDIYDKGITFWNNPNEIGQYNLDNSPNG